MTQTTFSRIVLYLDMDVHVRIRPFEFRDNAVQSKVAPLIEHCAAMVGCNWYWGEPECDCEARRSQSGNSSSKRHMKCPHTPITIVEASNAWLQPRRAQYHPACRRLQAMLDRAGPDR